MKARYLLFHDISARNKAGPGRPQKNILRPTISLERKREKKDVIVFKLRSRCSRIIKKKNEEKGQAKKANAPNVLYKQNFF